MEQVKRNKRIEWVDMLKGVAIICVIIGHRTWSGYGIFPCALKTWIYSFHMPLFFFLSGFVFSIDKYENFKQFLISKIKTMIIPMVFFSVVVSTFHYVYYGLLLHNASTEFTAFMKKMIFSLFLQGRQQEYNSALWFLTCLFVIQIILYGIVRFAKNLWYIFAAVLLCFIAGVAYVELGETLLLWEIDTALISIVFVGLGYILKKQIHILERISTYAGIIFLAINFVLTYANYQITHQQVDLAVNILGNPILFLLSALSAIMGLIILFKNCKNNRVLSYIGRNSLIYYGLSDMLLFLPELFVYNIIHLDISKLGEFSVVIGFGFAFVVCLAIWPMAEIINRKMKFVLGKF